MEKSFGLKKIVFLLVLVLYPCFTLQADDKREAESLIPIVVKLLGTGQLEEAGKFLEKAEQLDADNDAVQYYKGMLLLAASARVKEKNAKEMVDLLAAAGQCFAKAAVADSTNLWYKRRLGNLLFMLKQDQAAYSLYSQILAKSPYDTETISRQADVCINLGQYEKADSLIAIVEKIEGENGITMLSRLELLRQKGEYDNFFAAMQRFISSPMFGPEEKCDIINKFIASNDPHFNYLHLADYDALVQRCMEVYPSDSTTLNFAAGFYFSMEKYDRALALCGEKPENKTLAYVRFASNMMLAKYEDAIKDCDRLALMVGNDAKLLSEVYCNRADCLQYASRTSEAYKEYEHALKLNPVNIVALNNYAYLMCCNGRNLSKCEKMIKTVIDAEPENPTYLDTYGWILHKRKKDVEAKAVFKKAMLYGGKEIAEILNHYAEVLDSLGETSVAQAYREQAKTKQ